MCSYLRVTGLHVLGALVYVGFKHWHWHLLAQPWTLILLYCSEPSLQDGAHCVVGVWDLGESWCWGLGFLCWVGGGGNVCGNMCVIFYTNCVREFCVDFTAAILRAQF